MHVHLDVRSDLLVGEEDPRYDLRRTATPDVTIRQSNDVPKQDVSLARHRSTTLTACVIISISPSGIFNRI